jgi:hypothetical protein
VHKRIISACRRVEFVSDRMSYIILRGRWCNIVLNVQARREDKSDDVKDSFYEKLGCVFDPFPTYYLCRFVPLGTQVSVKHLHLTRFFANKVS